MAGLGFFWLAPEAGGKAADDTGLEVCDGGFATVGVAFEVCAGGKATVATGFEVLTNSGIGFLAEAGVTADATE